MMWDLSGSNGRRDHGRSSSPNPSFPIPQNTQSSPGGFAGGYAPSSYPPAMPSTGPAMPSSYFQYPSDQLQSNNQVPRSPVYANPPQVIKLVKKSKHHSKHHHHHHSSSSSRPQVIVHYSSSPAAPQIQHSSSHNQLPLPSPMYYQQSYSQPHLPQPSQPHLLQPSQPVAQNYHQADGQPLAEPFQYSKCTGRKKALCIGINYIGHPNELRGCINDAKRVRDFLIRRHKFRADDIVLLTDDSSDPRNMPTRRNILRGMQWLVRSAKPDDSLFFHYSGHGGQTPDLDGDEVDGFDEVIYPLDWKTSGHITDDTMHEIMVKPLPRSCRLTALFDCCHSGTVLDLPYIYSSSGRLKGSHITNRARKRKYSPADVISFSGCKDGQTSADTFAGGVAVGAMSHAFITSLRENPKQSYHGLLKSVRQILYPKYSQKPQLGSSHHIDTGLDFII